MARAGEREDFLNTINLGYDILSFPKPVKKLGIEMKQMRERNMEDILLSRRRNAETARELSGETGFNLHQIGGENEHRKWLSWCVCVHLCLLEQTCAYWWVRTGKGLITITKS